MKSCRVSILLLLSVALVSAGNSSAGSKGLPLPVNFPKNRAPKLELEKPKYAIVSPSGTMLTEAVWENVGHVSEGLLAVRKDNKYGFIDRTGNMQIEPQFDNALGFSEGLAAVAIAGKWGFIDRRGKIVIPPQFSDVKDFSEGLACVEKNGGFGRLGKNGYIDKSGRFVIPAKYQGGGSFNSGIARVWDGKTDAWSYIDKKGKVLFWKKQSGEFSNGFATCSPGGLTSDGFMDKTGKVLGDGERFSWVEDFSEGVAAVKTRDEKRAGFIDTTGRFISAPIYQVTHSFSEGLAAVAENGKWKYIDKNGNTVIDLNADLKSTWCKAFHDGLAIIKYEKENTSVIIDRSGKVIGKIQQPLEVMSMTVEDGMIVVLENKAVGTNEKPVLILPAGCE